jgi:hypothetical protein
MINTVEGVIEQYVSAWNEQGLENYLAAFALCWSEDAIYNDPNFFQVSGLQALAELAQSSLSVMPVRKFAVLTTPDHHHNVGRYTWKVDLPEETKEGFDYFEFNDDYKITRLVSFFGPLKPVV